MKLIVKLAVVAALLVTVLTVSKAATAGIDPVKASEVQQVNVALQGLPTKDKALTPATAQDRIFQWAREILPFYGHEGLTDNVTAPQDIIWYWAGLGDASLVDDYTFGIDAFTDCQPKGYGNGPLGPFIVTGPVFVNDHYINPVDAEYQDVGYIFTLTHELGHGQGICNGPSDYVESSTQLAALEVGSAIADSGNQLMKASLLHEWRDIILGSMVYQALVNDTLPEYYAYLKTVVTPREYSQKMARYRPRFTTADGRAGWAQVYREYSFAVYVKAEWCLHGGVLAASDKRGNLFAPHMMVPNDQPQALGDFTWLLQNLS
jgi:hypothetical protein